MANDPLARPAIEAANLLMQQLVAQARQGNSTKP